jgi:SdrD B-like domain/Bacterial Ig domain
LGLGAVALVLIFSINSHAHAQFSSFFSHISASIDAEVVGIKHKLMQAPETDKSLASDRPVMSDCDGDGIDNAVDVDDDNDGILDQVECPLIGLQACTTGFGYVEDLIQSDYRGTLIRTLSGYAVSGNAMGATLVTVKSPVEMTPAMGFTYTGSLLLATTGDASDTHQTFLLSSDSLWVYGYENYIIPTAVTKSNAFQSMPLPTGVAPSNVKSMTATFGTLVLLTKSGDVHIMGAVNAGMYGDGTTAANAVWHKATIPKAIKSVRVARGAAFALATDGTLYTWGSKTYNGTSGSTSGTANTTPIAMANPLPAGVTAAQIAMTTYASTASYFVLGSNGKVYALGYNSVGQLGINNTTSQITWKTVVDVAGTADLTNVRFIAGTDESDIWPSVSVILADSSLLSWGSNITDKIGGLVLNEYNPIVPAGSTGKKWQYIEAGGYFTSGFAGGQLCNVGANDYGAFGNGTTTNAAGYTCANMAYRPLAGYNCDEDNDGKPNHCDLDSDGDGCSDAVEQGLMAVGANNTTTYQTGADTDGDGLLDQFETAQVAVVDYAYNALDPAVHTACDAPPPPPPAAPTGCGANLIKNGDFENVYADFQHSYTYKNTLTSGCIGDADREYITILKQNSCKNHGLFSFWATAVDHTTGKADGKYLYIQAGDRNTSGPVTDQLVWKQTVTGLTPGKRYQFSYWAMDGIMNWDKSYTLTDGAGHKGSRAGHLAKVDGATVVTEVIFPYLTKMSQENWKKYSAYFTAKADGSVVLEIYNYNHYRLHGNDWSLDDLRLECVCDHDGDGISDLDDIDDDNDGILDLDEGCTVSMIAGEGGGSFGTTTAGTRRNTETPIAGYTYAAAPTALPAGGYAVVSQNAAIPLTSSTAYQQIQGHTRKDSADAYLAVKLTATSTNLYSKSFTISAPGFYDFGAFVANASTSAGSNAEIGVRIKDGSGTVVQYTTSGVIPSFSNGSYYAWVTTASTANLAAGAYTLEVYNISGANALVAIDDIFIRPFGMNIMCPLDTDTDGKPNSCDRDSDGDGCPDAFEAGASNSITIDSLVGPYGFNGLANAEETNDGEYAKVKYNLTYTKATDATNNKCLKPAPDTITVLPTEAGVATAKICPTGDDLTAGTATYQNCGLDPAESAMGNLVIDSNGCATWTPNVAQTTTVTTCLVKIVDGKADTTFLIIKAPPAPPCCGRNLIVNGDFELGYSGFMHSYTFKNTLTSGCITGADLEHITILNQNSCKNHGVFSFWATAVDHTTGSPKGQYLYVQAGNRTTAGPATDQVVWKQTVTGLTPGQKYRFSYWAMDGVMNFDQANTLKDGAGHTGSRAAHTAKIDGATVISENPFPYLTKMTQENWKEYPAYFTAKTDGTALLEILNLNQYRLHSNDWSLDDVVLECVCDYDNDCVADATDIDDDNDGVLDTEEGCGQSLIMEENFGTFGALAKNLRKDLANPITGYTYAASGALATNGYAVVAQNGAATLASATTWEPLRGHTRLDSTDAYLAVNQGTASTVLYTATVTAPGGKYDFGAFAANAATSSGTIMEIGVRIKDASGAVVASATTCPVPSFSNAKYYNWVEATNTAALAPGTYTLEVYNIGTTAAKIAIDDIYIRPLGEDMVCVQDTDADGIPDACDRDSDGDGCPDVCESGAIKQAGIDSLPGPYGANGLANSVENNDTKLATTTYKSSYTTAALAADVKKCLRPIPDTVYVQDPEVNVATAPICPTADDVPTSGTATYSNCGVDATEAAMGTMTFDANGCAIWTPNATQTDTVTTCVVKTVGGLSDTTFIVILPVPPFDAEPDQAFTCANVPATGDLSTNDPSVPTGSTYGNPAANPSNPDGGTALPTVNPDGTFTFTSSVAGEYNFMVPITTPTGQTVLVPLTIVVKDPTSNTPIALDDQALTPLNTPVTLPTLSNDQTGKSGSPLNPATVVVIDQPNNGTVTVDPVSGNTTYTPNAGFVGMDTLTYEVKDANGNVTTAQQIITILPADAPNTTSAVDDYRTTPYNTPVSGNALANDSDAEGNLQTVTPATIEIPGKGTLTIDAFGAYTFTPEPGFSGTVDFPYTVTDDNPTDPKSATAIIHIIVPAPPSSTLSLGNLVWNNSNNDGQKDTEEAGIPGVVVQLMTTGANGILGDSDDVLLKSDTTDANGNYLFEGLTPGTYYIKLPGTGIPADMISSTGNGPTDATGSGPFEAATGTNNNINNTDDGTKLGTAIVSQTIVLALNTEPVNDDDADPNTNKTVDFGLYIISTANPDVNSTSVNTPITGCVADNDKNLPTGTTYQNPPANNTNPDAGTNKPVINPDGTYQFMTDIPGVYTFMVPVVTSTGTVARALVITVKPYSCTGQPTYPFCAGDRYRLEAEAGLIGLQWYQGTPGSGTPIAGATNTVYIATEVGSYYWEATDSNSCIKSLCCPVEIVAGTNCPVPCLTPNCGTATLRKN